MSVLSNPGYNLQPSSQRIALPTNYITDFNFLNQYLPDTYEKEFERYGNRTVASFLRMVGAEMPTTSDQIKWAEQGRLHIKYTNCTSDETSTAAADSATITVNDALDPDPAATDGSANPLNTGGIAIRVGQTVMITSNTGTGANKGIVTAVDYANGTFDVAYYESGGQTFGDTESLTVFIYGSEFQKGTAGMAESLEANDEIFDNSPIIMKDAYRVTGSDMAQIGWIEVTTENGATGYLWYMKSEHETRLRFEDYMETAMLEAVPAESGSGAIATAVGAKGTKGIFYEVNNRGNVFGGGYPTVLSDFDDIISRLDKQGAIEENVLFLNREASFAMDDMLAAQNSYGAGGTSYGLFDNDEQMALNLGFSGFRRGYDFYKSDWKYLNDPTMRGGLSDGWAGATSAQTITGMLVPAGSTTVYDQVLGKNAKRPFLHVRYRASETEDRRYKTWMTGSAGGAATSDVDEMKVNFLTERAVCVMGANNFFLFRYGA
jgi:hypothetical protein